MDVGTILLLALALAMDCFAVSITNGVALGRFHFVPIMKMALLFGFFQALMPLVGWLAGVGFKERIEAYDHWIALGVLVFLGVKMIRESQTEGEEGESQPALHWKTLILLAIATSIDALATGLVFITETIPTFVFALMMIGLFSFALSVAGNLVGLYLGRHLPVNMELVGGLVLIGIGVKIFLEHTALLSVWFGF